MKTIIALGPRQFGDQQFAHGAEIPPGLLPPEVIDFHLDRKELIEFDSAERRSLYRLFPSFSGVKEKEQLSKEELTSYGLQE